ncbi:G-protein coupled receptor Mth2-like isoform X8 [Onthophagus taurus]|uniref:G-protein coupled receptor Mth2-like isoform X8 n=1 Tax=Onthophagus taurus TaxID=166361 RepID=UPI000C20A847|nr:G-protein coupled receptor Mth2-like isoform X8 [Onthophagus taurus]
MFKKNLIKLFCVVYVVNALENLCGEKYSVDITASEHLLNGSKVYDNITYEPKNYFEDAKNKRIYGCLCDFKKCIRKCCGLNEIFNGTTKMCDFNDQHPNILQALNHFEFLRNDVHIISQKLMCKNGTTRYIVRSSHVDLTEDIKFVYNNLIIGIENYCLDYIRSHDRPDALICVDLNQYKHNIPHVAMGMIISMPFLIATFLVYALLPDKNLPAKSLMCYVLSLLFAYIMLVTIQLNSNLEHGACVTIAYLCYFFFMVSFFWMNSSCIDIWLTFSGIKGITGQRTQERKRFIYYCLYSWGLPLIMTSIVVVMTMEHLKDSIFFTAIGDGQCWFKNGLSTGIYFYFPIAILLITNIVLFAITALKIRNVQRDTKVLNAKDSSKHEKDKQRIDEYNSEPCYLIEPVKNRGMQVYDFLDVDNSCLGFNLYIKLLFAMGVNWSMEVISWLVQWQSNNVPTYIWYITDFCNAMYGVLIFFIFVFKKNIWIMLKKRYLQIMGRSTRAHSMGTSTHRTTLFTAISLQSIPGAGLLTKMHSTPNDNRNELRPPKIH